MNMPEIISRITANTAQVIPTQELEKKLKKNTPLTIKLGMDPTAPDLHLGHAVVLEKLKDFQDLGHNVIFLIGDFTAQIGDPTGKSKTRPPLSKEEIKKNMHTYFEQVGKILDINNVTVVYNSTWLSPLHLDDIIKLCSRVTLARIIEREDFANRIKKHEPVSMHELFYPILQGYDSVELNADIEIGGTDQTFNMHMGRLLQEQYSKEPQVIITMPLLEGLDGVQKMSKSLGNAIGFAESADQAFGKLMSISDALMWRYAELLLKKSSSEIAVLQERIAAGTLHPMACKKDIARQIVARYWSDAQAEQARTQFESLFQKKDYSAATPISIPSDTANPVWIVDLLKLLHAIKTSSEAKRLIESRAILINDDPVTDFKASINWHADMTIKVGKHRIYRIV